MEGLGTTEEISEPGGKSFAAGLFGKRYRPCVETGAAEEGAQQA